MDKNLSGLILQQWQQTMPNVTMLLMQKMQQTSEQQNFARQGMARVQPPQGSDSRGAAENGAAAGPNLQLGGTGPYGDGTSQSNEQAQSGSPLPEQKPPRRSNSPV